MRSGNERLRPPGFPLTEEELQQLKRLRMAEIIDGSHVGTYSEWILRGVPKEPFNPTTAIAIFPVPATTPKRYLYEPETECYEKNGRTVSDYWKEISTLSLPERVKWLERSQYKGLANIGDQILEEMSLELVRNLMPSAMIVFSRPDPVKEESVYLICPTLIPPSAAYRFIQLHAKKYLHSS